MARTKASVGSKVAAGKSSKARCSVAPTPSSSGTLGSSAGTSRSSSGGNPVCPRETPKWQKPITNFFINKDEPRQDDEVDVEDKDDKEAGTSKPKQKSNVIHSDTEEEVLTEKANNTALDDSIILEPLNGEDSHKIEEYYAKGPKGKGIGKKSKGKENKMVTDEEDVENSSNKSKGNENKRVRDEEDVENSSNKSKGKENKRVRDEADVENSSNKSKGKENKRVRDEEDVENSSNKSKGKENKRVRDEEDLENSSKRVKVN